MTNTIPYIPGSYWFGISYESDIEFAKRLHGKTRREFITTVEEYWNG